MARTYGHRGEVDPEGVHPVVVGHDWILDGDMPRNTLTVAGLTPVAEGSSHMSLEARKQMSEE